jgi:hypothetical protein
MTRSLIDEVPEARQFIESACRSWEKFKRYPLEEFINVRGAVLATSGVDLQNECFAPEGLYEMAEHIRQNSLWLMHEHNPLIPPLGRILAAKCFYATNSQLNFVVGAVGFYDSSLRQTFSSLGIDFERLPLPEPIMAEVDDAAHKLFTLSYNPHEIPPRIIEDLLRDAPPQIAEQATLVGRKAADPLTILSVVTSLWVLLSNPFAKKLSERLGEHSADFAADVGLWLKARVIAAFSRLEKEALFEFECHENGCRVEFIVPSRDRLVLQKSIDTVQGAAVNARALVAALTSFGPEKLVYRFDPNTLQWWPLYAATRLRGVIKDERILIAAERLPLRDDADHTSPAA